MMIWSTTGTQLGTATTTQTGTGWRTATLLSPELDRAAAVGTVRVVADGCHLAGARRLECDTNGDRRRARGRRRRRLAGCVQAVGHRGRGEAPGVEHDRERAPQRAARYGAG